MRQVPDWDRYYLDLAVATAARSKDPITQVGAVIVNNDGRIISQGYNGMIAGAFDTCGHWQNKDDLVIHAEENAIANAARSGASTLGASIYITIAPCPRCMRLIAASGIKSVMYDRLATATRLGTNEHRLASFAKSWEYARAADIEWRDL